VAELSSDEGDVNDYDNVPYLYTPLVLSTMCPYQDLANYSDSFNDLQNFHIFLTTKKSDAYHDMHLFFKIEGLEYTSLPTNLHLQPSDQDKRLNQKWIQIGNQCANLVHPIDALTHCVLQTPDLNEVCEHILETLSHQ